jgi:hypothetical protein
MWTWITDIWSALVGWFKGVLTFSFSESFTVSDVVTPPTTTTTTTETPTSTSTTDTTTTQE